MARFQRKNTIDIRFTKMQRKTKRDMVNMCEFYFIYVWILFHICVNFISYMCEFYFIYVWILLHICVNFTLES